jgi:chromosome partitioning protein
MLYSMKVISIISRKGGSGKSTLAINLAVAADRAGHAVIVVDLDPQSSAAAWGDLREADAPAVVAVPPARLAQALAAAAASGADLAILDTAPHSEGSALAAARAADIVLIPARLSLLDLQAIGATADLARIAGKPAYAVLNAAPPGATRLVDDARRALAVHGLTLALVIVAHRAAFVRSLPAGMGVIEFDPNGKAAGEMRQLFAWVAETIGLKGYHRGKR